MLFTRSPRSFTNQNEVRLVKSGSDFFDLAEQLIGQAREHINLQTYIFAEDETGTRIANALSECSSTYSHSTLNNTESDLSTGNAEW